VRAGDLLPHPRPHRLEKARKFLQGEFVTYQCPHKNKRVAVNPHCVTPMIQGDGPSYAGGADVLNGTCMPKGICRSGAGVSCPRAFVEAELKLRGPRDQPGEVQRLLLGLGLQLRATHAADRAALIDAYDLAESEHAGGGGDPGPPVWEARARRGCREAQEVGAGQRILNSRATRARCANQIVVVKMLAPGVSISLNQKKKLLRDCKAAGVHLHERKKIARAFLRDNGVIGETDVVANRCLYMVPLVGAFIWCLSTRTCSL
jgi:hypothetical protein